MKIIFSLTLLLFTTITFSFEIPKKLLGRYETHIPDFEFQDNGRTVQATGYNIAIALKEDYLWYYCGSIQFYGVYTQTSEDDENIDISVNVSNGLSIAFDVDLTVNKKTRSIAITGLIGIPDVTLKKYEISVTRKS